MSIYTKNGDLGNSSLLNAKNKPKHNLEFEVLGKLDELQALLYNALVYSSSKEKFLESVCRDIQLINAYIAGASNISLVARLDEKTKTLEKEIDFLEEKLPKLKGFTRPKENKFSVHLNLVRVKAREAERYLVKFLAKKNGEEKGAILKYINRLSDYLFMKMLD
jgi:cob(I)alamin adenosyltransferase